MNDDGAYELQQAQALSEYLDLLNSRNASAASAYRTAANVHGSDVASLLDLVGKVREITHGKMMSDGYVRGQFARVRDRIAELSSKGEFRKAIEAGAATVPVNKRPDCMLLLLRTLGRVAGNTRVVKYLFLMGKEAGCDSLVPDFYAHYAYHYGPFDDNVMKDLDELVKRGLVRREVVDDEADALRPDEVQLRASHRPSAVYSLTNRGAMFAEALFRYLAAEKPELAVKLEAVLQQYASLTREDLLRYIYTKYPDYARNSKIKEELLGGSA